MNELIKVSSNENDEQVVSGRELHQFLEVKTAYKDWFPRMVSYGFNEGVDFVKTEALKKEQNDNGAVLNDYIPLSERKNLIDHGIKIDMAKEISMIQRSEKGRQARQYFIQVEKQWNSEEMILMRSRQILERKVEKLASQVEKKDLVIQEMQPKALFADSVSTSQATILIGELAKILKQNSVNMGQNRLFSWLRDNGYLIRRKGTDYNMPTQRSMELGLFEVKESVITHSDGHIGINKTPKVTGKGQVYFVNKFLA